MKAGTRLGGRYRLERRLGQGGMGQVWRAHDERLGRDVALKTLRGGGVGGADALRLRREARATAALEHRGIAQVYDIEATPDGLVYVVMELVEGHSLRQRLNKDGPLPVDDVRAILREVATTLQVAHDAGLLHRDIKPDNLMQRPDGSMVVLDFGLAKDLSPTRSIEAESPTEAALTDSGALLGTPAYLSPEQARGKKVGPATDQWSLAVTGWELLTGRRPWDAESIPETLLAILEQEPALASEVRRAEPLELAERLARGMKKDPEQRFERVEELVGERETARAPRARDDGPIAHRTALLLGLGAYVLLGFVFARAAPPNGRVEDEHGTSAIRDGRLELSSVEVSTALRQGWLVHDGADWVPFDDDQELGAQGVRPRARMRYLNRLRFAPEGAARARERGLALLGPFTWQNVSLRVGDGPFRPCAREWVFDHCLIDGIEDAIDSEGHLDLEVLVEVPGWVLWSAPDAGHLRPARRFRGDLSVAPTEVARGALERGLLLKGRGTGALTLVLAAFFLLLGFRRHELSHYRHIGFYLVAIFLFVAHNQRHWAWFFPGDPMPWAYLLGTGLYALAAGTMLEMSQRLLGVLSARWHRGLQALAVGMCLAGMPVVTTSGYLVTIGGVLLALFVSAVSAAVAFRRGVTNAAPLLWLYVWSAFTIVVYFLRTAGVTTLSIEDSGALALGLAFGFIAARDLFAARLSVEDANQSLERRVEERTAALARANAKLTELDQAKTRFFENVSHELRTPLTLILGPVNKLLSEGTLSDETRGPVTLVARHARRLLRMVNRLLDVQRLDAGRMHVEAVRTDVAALARRVADGFVEAAKQRELEFEVTAEQPAEADIDPRLFEDVLFNLLSNALKFTPKGGRVRLSVTTDGQSRRPVVIEVRDSGSGIPKAQQRQIFERFRRVEGRRRAGGTGVGLALVKELVAAHRGTVEVESEEGFGTTFTVRLPPASLEEASLMPGIDADRLALELAHLDEAAVSLVGQTPGAEARPILLVDDHADLRAYVRGCLEPHYRVIEARDGDEALALLLEGEHVDAVVSDVMMPRMDGYELLDHVRSTPALSELPFILLTAKSSADMRVEGLDAGADDYVSKPFDPAELRVRIRNVLRLRAN